jgi:hypothetical protein
MPVPRNSIPMVGTQGKHDYIDMSHSATPELLQPLTS